MTDHVAEGSTAAEVSARVDAALDRATSLLRANGERMTAPRRAVVRALAESAGHLTAEDIFDAVAVQPSAPDIHRASVYRALDSLTRIDLVRHVHMGHGAIAHHLADPDDSAHLHALCAKCRKVVDLPAELLDEVAEEVRRAEGFVLDPTHVALSGVCRDCAAKAR